MQARPILIIDDDLRICELADAILKGAGFKVLAAFDGPTGIETARAAQPGVVLVDMMMPGVDGIGTCVRLKQDPVLGDIPLIGMTASTEVTYTERAFQAGAAFFLPKPFGAENLLRVIKLAGESAQRHTRIPGRQLHTRFPVEIPVRCLVGTDTTREIAGQTGNASLSGLLLVLPEKLAPGTIFRLRLGLPDGAIPAEGTVIWQSVQGAGRGRVHHGIELLPFSDDTALVQYRRFLSQVAVGNAPGVRS